MFSPSKTHMSKYCYSHFVRNWGTESNVPKLMWPVNRDIMMWIQPVFSLFLMPPSCLLELPPAQWQSHAEKLDVFAFENPLYASGSLISNC